MSTHVQKNHLLLIEDDSGQRRVVLDAPIYSIGRDTKCDIHLSSKFVSRHHATLFQLENDDNTVSYRIVDGDAKGRESVNGLIINGHRLEAHDLSHEDEVVFGPRVRATYYLVKSDHSGSRETDQAGAGSSVAATSGAKAHSNHQESAQAEPSTDTSPEKLDYTFIRLHSDNSGDRDHT